jgi:redox-sensitive bicupin YhaK (pirin superfamily)
MYLQRGSSKYTHSYIHLCHFSSYFILGFETVSYLLEGEFIHEDCLGHKGLLKAGDLQWITAGKGIIHSEMPGPIDTRGLQLWVNLKNEHKMVEPKYQELEAKDIPFGETDGVHVKVIAGESMGIKSPVKNLTPTHYLDFTLKPGSSFIQPVPEGWTTFLYTLDGEIKIGAEETLIKPHCTVVLGKAI